jgi:hypothetical protein
MPERRLWVPYLMLIAVSIILLYWYPLQLIAAIEGNSSQGAFIAAEASNHVYYFTVAGAIISFILVTLFILKQERFKPSFIPLALAVAYITTISVAAWYEQLYANIGDVYYHIDYWRTYYSVGSPPGYALVVIDMLLILVAYPWMRRSNLKVVLLLVLLTLLSFACWILVGYGRPNTSWLDYLFNASSRIMSDLALAFTMRPARNANPSRQPTRTTSGQTTTTHNP